MALGTAPGGLAAHQVLVGPAVPDAAPSGVVHAVAAQEATQPLTLGVGVAPSKICAYASTACAAGTGTARVTLTATPAAAGIAAWPAVQVAFVIETTPYDGVSDMAAGDPGSDPCVVGSGQLCEESNGVPFFVANAQLIAQDIQAANPDSRVSFAMVDYFATLTDHDDDDGSEYHVDIQDFVPASEFGSAVRTTFQAEVLLGGWYYDDSDMSDNTLSSSSITALYGTITGSGLDWSNNTHHVIVWMGSTCPRDPSCIEDYSVSDSSWANSGSSDSSPCEPSYAFPTGASPQCEGWIVSHDGNASHSIAQLARTSPSCTDSIGGVCTIDTIDLWTTPTDPYSDGWGSTASGGGPGGSKVVADVDKIIGAGCALAQATGGTWDGPSGFVCPDGQLGNLQYVPYMTGGKLNFNNPTLLTALTAISFGNTLQDQIATGTDRPMFLFVPFGAITLPLGDAELSASAHCEVDGHPFASCQTTPTILDENGTYFLGWNWSTNPSQNVLYAGDSWSASFNVFAAGGPFTTVPVDACTTAGCEAGHSGTVSGMYSEATFTPYLLDAVMNPSFPLGQVTVEPTPLDGYPPAPPVPSSPGGAGIPVAVPNPTGLVQPLAVGASAGGTPNAALQAAAAGFLGAGFVRVAVKNQRMAVPIAARASGRSGHSRTNPRNAQRPRRDLLE